MKLLREPIRLLSVKEAAAQLGVSVRTTWRLLRTGALPSVHVGKLRRIRDVDVEAFKLSGGATH